MCFMKGQPEEFILGRPEPTVLGNLPVRTPDEAKSSRLIDPDTPSKMKMSSEERIQQDKLMPMGNAQMGWYIVGNVVFRPGFRKIPGIILICWIQYLSEHGEFIEGWFMPGAMRATVGPVVSGYELEALV